MQAFLQKIYLFRFLEAFKLIGVIFTLFFAQNGLTPFEISLLIGIWSITQLVLEVPLGAVADKYPRRNLLITALIIVSIGFALWLRGGFIFYALGFILWGVKNALVSGTLEAFVYDELKSYKSEHLYEKVNGKMEAYFWLGVTLSAVLGGIIASSSFEWVILLTIVTTLISAALLLTIRSVKQVQSTGEQKYLMILKSAIKEVKHNHNLLTLIVFFCLAFAVFGAADEYWALLYKELDIPIELIGLLVAIGYGIFSLAGILLKYFDKLRWKNAEYALLIISGFLFVIAGVINNPFALPVIFVGLLLFKVSHLKFDAKFQHSIQAEHRATISSLKSLIFELVYFGSVLGLGFISTKLGLTSILYILGVFLIFLATIFTLKYSRKF